MLQHAFRYGDPIFVTVETVEQLKHDKSLSSDDEQVLLGSKWWLALLTTRVLLAHTIYVADTHNMLDPVIANVRNILRVVGIDISDKETFPHVKDNETVFYCPRQPNGKFWLSLKGKRDTIMNELKATTFDVMNDEITELVESNEAVKLVFNLFARSVHELVSTRDSGWKTKTNKYKDFTFEGQ